EWQEIHRGPRPDVSAPDQLRLPPDLLGRVVLDRVDPLAQARHDRDVHQGVLDDLAGDEAQHGGPGAHRAGTRGESSTGFDGSVPSKSFRPKDAGPRAAGLPSRGTAGTPTGPPDRCRALPGSD